MDRIEIKGLRVFAHHGVLPQERAEGQVFVLDVAAELDLSGPGRSDALADTLDYAALAADLARITAGTRYDLIEALAERLAGTVLADQRVFAVDVRIAKPSAPLEVESDEVAVWIRRERGRGVGS